MVIVIPGCRQGAELWSHDAGNEAAALAFGMVAHTGGIVGMAGYRPYWRHRYRY